MFDEGENFLVLCQILYFFWGKVYLFCGLVQQLYFQVFFKVFNGIGDSGGWQGKGFCGMYEVFCFCDVYKYLYSLNMIYFFFFLQ